MDAEFGKATDLDENSCLLCSMSWRNMPWRCWHYASSMFQSSYGKFIRIILKIKMAKAHHYKEDSQHTRFSLFWIWKHKWFNIMLRIECEPWMHVSPMVYNFLSCWCVMLPVLFANFAEFSCYFLKWDPHPKVCFLTLLIAGCARTVTQFSHLQTRNWARYSTAFTERLGS